jgi:hypothetical protein
MQKSPRSTGRGNLPARQRSNSYAIGTRRTARPQRYHHGASHALVLRVDAGALVQEYGIQAFIKMKVLSVSTSR